MEYINVAQAAELWGISDRRVRILCQQGKIEGVIRKGRSYLIPSNAVKPIDGRTLRHKDVSEQYIALFSRIDALKEQLDQRRLLTLGELQRLQEEFLVELPITPMLLRVILLPYRKQPLYWRALQLTASRSKII